MTEKTQEMLDDFHRTDVQRGACRNDLAEDIGELIPTLNIASARLMEMSSKATRARMTETDAELVGQIDNFENRVAAELKLIEEAKVANRKVVSGWESLERDFTVIQATAVKKGYTDITSPAPADPTAGPVDVVLVDGAVIGK